MLRSLIRSAASKTGFSARSFGSTTGPRAAATRVFSWGEGNDGQLGHVNYQKTGVPPSYKVLAPTEIPILSSLGVVSLACGTAHSACVTEDGHVLTWGKGDKHRLGHGSEDEEAGPRIVEALKGEKVVSVECGEAFTAALTADGRVFTWGYGGGWVPGQGGALGHGDSKTRPVPEEVEFFSQEHAAPVVQIAAGKGHMLALDADGQVWSWGKGEHGRLGIGGSSAHSVPMPVDVNNDTPCQFIAAGEHFSGAITDDKEVFMWGRNDQNQLGLGGGLAMDYYSMEEFPTRLADNVPDHEIHDMEIETISLGVAVAACTCSNGEVYSWGARTWIEPRRMSVLSDEGIWMVGAASNVTAALSASGTLFTWSRSGMFGRSAALGHGDQKSVTQPTPIESMLEHTIVGIACGKSHMLALVESDD